MSNLKWAFVTDAHAPFTDREAWTWACQQIQDHKPDIVVMGGDLLEGDAASRWENENDHDLLHEFAVAGELLAELEGVAPAAERVWLHGNHDANILGMGRLSRKIRGLADWTQRHELLPEARRWKQIPYVWNPGKCVYRRGQVTFFHGFGTSDSAFKQDCFEFGVDWGLNVFGHTHRPTEHPIEVKLGKQSCHRWYANGGCFFPMDKPPHYVERQRWTEWGQAVVLGDLKDLKSPRVGRYWECEVRIKRMAGDSRGAEKWRSALKAS